MPYPLLQLFSKKAKTKKPHTTPKERVQILLSLQNGHTTRQIAKSTNISPSTVSRINKRWREKHSLKDAPKPGRPSTINETIKNKIVNLITSRRCSSAPEAQKCIEEKENISISSPTIRRILHANGLVSRIKRKKPYLSSKHRKRR
ncbi:2272_t:CDS:1, partial [Entrophospora sp. SA101]